MELFSLLVVAAGILLVYWLTSTETGKRVKAALFPPTEPTPEPEPSPEPEVILPPRPAEGNIREIPEERDNPLPAGDTFHVFPDRPKFETRFDEFNAKLFVYRFSEKPQEWPITTTDDFPTVIVAKDNNDLFDRVSKQLRPRYPVIIDQKGWWRAASVRLEMDPDSYTDPVVAAYLQMPFEVRPVIVSAENGTDGPFVFLRYGFEKFFFYEFKARPFLTASLAYIMRAFTGDEAEWQWFSIARMRKQLILQDKENQAAQTAMDKMQEESRRLAHENRFTALWQSRVRLEQELLEAPEGDDAEVDT